MPKILILANDNSTIYNFRKELLQKLLTERYDVFISLPADEKNQEFLDMGSKVVENHLDRFGTNPIKELLLINEYLKIIKKIHPDLVLTYTIKPNIYGSLICQYLRIPYINTVTGLGSGFQKKNILKYLLTKLICFAFKKSSCVFFENNYIRKMFLDKFRLTIKNILIPGTGVNLDLHRFEDYPKKNSITKFITVSRIRKDKGFNELFDAIKKLSRYNKNVEFHIVGWLEDEAFKKKLNIMVSDYPVNHHGKLNQNQVHEILKKSHCLIHPSYHEGLANAILEAASCGRPCLVSDIPGCREAIEDSKTGFVFKVKDSRSLINTINKFLLLTYEQRKTMGIAGRKKMENEFDREQVISTYINEIKKLT